MAKHLTPRSKVNKANSIPVKKKSEIITTDTSPYVFQRDKIAHDIVIRELPWTEKQKSIIDLIMNKKTKIVFLSGPSGVAKSILAAYCGLRLLQERKASEIIYVRSIVESASRSMGFLPGELQSKFLPFLDPLLSKLEELTRASDITKLLQDERVKPMPINFLRGASYNAKYIIVDEAQNMVKSELTTAITRIGLYSRFIICGDPMQSDLRGHEVSGFKPMFDLFNNEESREQGIFCVELGVEDIMRSEILKFIVEKLQTYK